MLGPAVHAPSPWRARDREEHEVSRAKKVLIWFVIAFAVYAIFKSPDQAAGIVGSAWDGIVTGFSAIGRFFDALLGS